LSGQNIPDLNSGLRVFRREIVLDNLNLLCDGFSFTSTITLIMLCSNYPVKYVPIDYYTRSGSSKIRPFHDTVNFLILIITTVLYFRPLRVFLPPALALLGGGTLWGLWQVISQQDISGAPMLLIQTGFYLLTIALLADMIAKSRPVKHVRHLRNR
jgi:hypothetical protein